MTKEDIEMAKCAICGNVLQDQLPFPPGTDAVYDFRDRKWKCLRCSAGFPISEGE